MPVPACLPNPELMRALCGRIASSTVFDVLNEWADGDKVTLGDVVAMGVDVAADAFLSSGFYDFFDNALPKGILGESVASWLNGTYDGIIDVLQTIPLNGLARSINNAMDSLIQQKGWQFD